MAADSIIIVGKQCFISVDCERLKFEFASGEQKLVAACDIAAVIAADKAVSVTCAVLKVLALNGAVFLTVDDAFLPIALSLPLNQNMQGAKRPHQQSKYIDSEYSKKWWNTIIKSKICGQASVIKDYDMKTFDALSYIARQIKAGDEHNAEGNAAKIYWKSFFKIIDRDIDCREKPGASDIVNSCLNYSYAILRSAVARSLAAGGYCLNFGVGHCRRDNPFNLAEDFIEPFRFIAEKTVLKILKKYPQDDVLTSNIKKELITDILAAEISVGDCSYRLFSGINFVIESFGRVLDDPRRKLLLPNQN